MTEFGGLEMPTPCARCGAVVELDSMWPWPDAPDASHNVQCDDCRHSDESGAWCPHPDCHDRAHLDGTHTDEHGRPFRHQPGETS